MTMYPVLTASTFLPSVGAAAHLLVSRATGALDCAGDDNRHAGGFGSALSALRQDLERSAVCRKPAMDSVMERGLRHGRRRHQPAVHFPLGSGQRAVRRRVVECDSGPRVGVLRDAARCRNRDDRAVCGDEFFSLLRVLGAHGRSHVPAHRRVGRAGPRPRRAEVPDFHAGGKPA